MAEAGLMEKIVSLSKRRGFIYPGSEIYGGLAGTWDMGPMGVQLKNNIKNLWWRMFVDERDDMYGVDAAILMNPKAWEASGHVSGFSDPSIQCKKCGSMWRVDALIDSQEPVKGVFLCPFAGCKNPLGTRKQLQELSRPFNLMFETKVGAGANSTLTYLRPETAGGMFVNFKNVIDSFHPDLPFGLAQIGKVFRNEIAPRDFVFRAREFEQMEIEYFVRPGSWKEHFEKWRTGMLAFMDAVGIDSAKVHELEVADQDRAHYSKRTIDFEFEYPFGRKELYGLAYRTDFDLSAHAEHSGIDLSYLDESSKTRFIPHVIEPSFGVERTVLAVLISAYSEDALGDERRVYLKLKPSVAPVKAAVFPLLKNKPALVQKAREVYALLKHEVPNIVWDDNGNIGKRYRRQDEIGTPFCITIDFDTVEKDGNVTVRDRDTGRQERFAVLDTVKKIKEAVG